MTPQDEFEQQVKLNIKRLSEDPSLKRLSNQWIEAIVPHKYTYNFKWLGRPIIQIPQDMVAVQELIWRVMPDLIIETGIAHGGSLVLSASILAMLDYQEAVFEGVTLDPAKPRRRVLGVDIDIREHNREAIENHAMKDRINMIEGSSTDPDVVARVSYFATNFDRVMVFLDSNHSHEHVLSELEAYAGLTSVGSYCVVFDTVIAETSNKHYSSRPWGHGDNPKTATRQFLATNSQFVVDKEIDSKLQLSVAPGGFLRKVS